MKVVNDRVQSNPVFSIFGRGQDQYDPRPLPCLDAIIKRLADRLGPFFGELDFNGMG
jgi:hypothetical protein